MVTKTIKKFVGKLLSKPSTNKSKPQTYTYETHQINRRMVSRHAIKVCEVLHQHGYKAFIVGGAVRDLLVGIQPQDFDVATNATPEQIRPLFRRARIIGRRFRLVHVVFGREIIETSTFRAPSKTEEFTDEHGRILRDNLFGTQQEDAARRDFTLNALYYDPISETVIDFHNGLKDLQHRLVRIIGEAETRYREDPVRMLRALRFAAKLDANIEANTLAPIKLLAPLIKNVPSSRLIDELVKILTCGNAMACINAMRASELHESVLPLLDETCALPNGESFIELALERTDKRVRTGQPVSASYMFAALLWPLTQQEWHKQIAQGEHPTQGLVLAASYIIERHARKLPLQKRFCADMREIWFMQARFERPSARNINRLTEHPRFRAAVDFLQMRAAARETDSVQAQWWMDLADGDENTRKELIASLVQPAKSGAARRRRRRKPRRDNPPKTLQG